MKVDAVDFRWMEVLQMQLGLQPLWTVDRALKNTLWSLTEVSYLV